jgi:hypothetical protein
MTHPSAGEGASPLPGRATGCRSGHSERRDAAAGEIITHHEGQTDWEYVTPAWAKHRAKTYVQQASAALDQQNRILEWCDARPDLSDEHEPRIAADLDGLLRRQDRARRLAWAWQVIAGRSVTAKSPRSLQAEYARNDATIQQLRRMPDQARFKGLTLGEIRRSLGHTSPRRVAADAGRPAASSRRSGSSSSTSGSDPGSDDPHQDEPAAAPEAAREAIAACWATILRERSPGTSWEVSA